MKKKVFQTIAGDGVAHDVDEGSTRKAMREAQARGFHVGLRVRIGEVVGVIIGYNIAGRGRFRGAKFPIVVQTPFGVAKCSLGEIRLA